MKLMDKIDQLLVRACKSTDPQKRIRSLYRRFWISTATEKQMTNCITGRLATIIDDYHLSCFTTMLREKHWYTHDSMFGGKPVDVDTFLFNYFISTVRLCPYTAFNGELTALAQFRRK